MTVKAVFANFTATSRDICLQPLPPTQPPPSLIEAENQKLRCHSNNVVCSAVRQWVTNKYRWHWFRFSMSLSSASITNNDCLLWKLFRFSVLYYMITNLNVNLLFFLLKKAKWAPLHKHRLWSTDLNESWGPEGLLNFYLAQKKIYFFHIFLNISSSSGWPSDQSIYGRPCCRLSTAI